MLRLNHPATRYTLAIAIAFFALYLRYLLLPLYGGENPYHTVWLAVIFSAWLCGLGPSIATTLLGALGVWYWFLPPYHFSGARNRYEIFGMLSFLAFSAAIIALGESNRRASATQFMLGAIVGSSEDAIVSKDLNGVITSWNESAQRLFGWTAQEAVGRPVTTLIPPESLDEEKEILGRIRVGQRVEQYETVRVSKSGKRLEVSLTVSPIKDLSGRVVGAAKIARDISERKQIEARIKAAHDELEQRVKERTAEIQERNNELANQTAVVQELSARLLKLQDEERRRLARELHDSVGQLLAVMNMNMSDIAAEKQKLSAAAQKCVDESVSLADQLSRDIRTISHLLHPPLLDEVGLSSALKWYIDGFSERSKIDVSLDMPDNFERLTDELEISIFRIVQECLTNIHRHSGSAKATIRLADREGYIHVEIRDEGRGIPLEKQAILNSSGTLGVGFRGMRERVRQLGGTLRIQSDGAGTTVVVTLRRPAESAQTTSTRDRFLHPPASSSA